LQSKPILKRAKREKYTDITTDYARLDLTLAIRPSTVLRR
jgi:hypothetical protein